MPTSLLSGWLHRSVLRIFLVIGDYLFRLLIGCGTFHALDQF